MSDSSPIRNVSDTALWVAIYRAMESERPDALFRDPYARRLGGARGEAIVESMPQGASMAWPLVVRTAVMDEIIQRCVRQGARTVLNLAAGLDARPYRLDLPASLRWIHVDMPDMVAYFREAMAGETAHCQLDFVAADLRDAGIRREVFASAAQRGPVLVITEGLLIYLTADDAAALSRDLHDVAKAKWWLSDIASPVLMKFLEKNWAPTLRNSNAPFQFAPRESTAFFAPYGWRELEFRSTGREAQKLKRAPRGAWVWKLFSLFQSRATRDKYQRMSGIFLLEST